MEYVNKNVDSEVVLSPEVNAEPLVDGWYAWLHLLSPCTAALRRARHHLRLLESFVKSPALHASTARQSALAGGFFVELEPERVNEVGQLVNRMREDTRMLELVNGIVELHGLLTQQQPGASLADVYLEVPACLRGLVELVYDSRGAPNFRFVEALLYDSEHHRPELQSVQLRASGQRSFSLSTPRLLESSAFSIGLPFGHGGYDTLFRSRSEPTRFGTLCDALEISAEQSPRFASNFVHPRGKGAMADSLESYDADRQAPRWRHFGHASVLVEVDGVNVMFDPIVSTRANSPESSRHSFADLPKTIDYVVITHGHQDHFYVETLLQIRHRVGCAIVPSTSSQLHDPSLRLALQELGYSNIVELSDLESMQLGADFQIVALPFFGEHGDLSVCGKAAYLLRAGGRMLMFAADSAVMDPLLYRRIRAAVGNVDTLFLGTECRGAPASWLYGPLFLEPVSYRNDQARRLAGCDTRGARQMIEHLGVREVYIYALGQEPWLGHVMGLENSPDSIQLKTAREIARHCNMEGISCRLLVNGHVEEL